MTSNTRQLVRGIALGLLAGVLLICAMQCTSCKTPKGQHTDPYPYVGPVTNQVPR